MARQSILTLACLTLALPSAAQTVPPPTGAGPILGISTTDQMGDDTEVSRLAPEVLAADSCPEPPYLLYFQPVERPGWARWPTPRLAFIR